MEKKINLAVAIPTYKRPHYLSELIKTIPKDIYISVSDNDSSTVNSGLSFDENVHIDYLNRLIPIFSNWNNAAELIPESYDYLIIPSDDDLFLKDAFELVFESIRKYPDADMLVFGCDIVDEHGIITSGWKPEREEFCENGTAFLKFYRGVNARMPGIIFKRRFLKKIGLFDESFELTAADSELIQRASIMGSIVFVPKVIGLYRVWGGSLTASTQATLKWMNEIRLWTSKISKLIKNNRFLSIKINSNHFECEILALNQLAAISGLYKNGKIKEARNFSNEIKIPGDIRISTKIRLIKIRFFILLSIAISR